MLLRRKPATRVPRRGCPIPTETVGRRDAATGDHAAIGLAPRAPPLLPSRRQVRVVIAAPVPGADRATAIGAESVMDGPADVTVVTAEMDAVAATVRSGSKSNFTRSIRSSIAALRTSKRRPAHAASPGRSSSAPSPTRLRVSRSRRVMCCSATASTANFPAWARHATPSTRPSSTPRN